MTHKIRWFAGSVGIILGISGVSCGIFSTGTQGLLDGVYVVNSIRCNGVQAVGALANWYQSPSTMRFQFGATQVIESWTDGACTISLSIPVSYPSVGRV